ncbi:Maf family protein [Pedobacter antarcticus]|uniref:Maf family protein n=1 Tax=Pedobacter antarcticus TaxID=34086 RepID=UPI00088388B7|nr:Maf family nucleotide pyrophosphatase [Pedobacter antarcticus]SDM67619.1 septum formation protein [Pedobacter antarcticus]
MFKPSIPLILASKSPRRQELIKLMGLEVEVLLKDVDESYPDGLSPAEIASYISAKKAEAFQTEAQTHVVITADTIVAFEGEILGKPKDAADAKAVLEKLSGKSHQVYTGVSLAYQDRIKTFCDLTEVTFRELTPEEIVHYIAVYRPFDKAGSYGIQDWLGSIAIVQIIGSYPNVMGLPTEKLYKELSEFLA